MVNELDGTMALRFYKERFQKTPNLTEILLLGELMFFFSMIIKYT